MHFSPLASALLSELNECRSNPPLYSCKLSPLLPLFTDLILTRPGKVNLRTKEGPAAVSECIDALEHTPPLGTLTLSPGMCRAAQSLCDECGPTGRFEHTGLHGSTLASRLEQHGRWLGSCGENLSSGCEDAQEILFQLLIDDGVPSRGHRENILNPAFAMVGVGFGPHKKYRCMCTIDFAGRFEEGKSVPAPAARPGMKSVPKPGPSLHPHKPGVTVTSKKGPSTATVPRSTGKGAVGAGGHSLAPSPMMSQLDPDFQQSARDWPPGAVSFHSKTSISTKDGRKVTKVVKTYKMADGSEITEESTTVN